MTRPRTVLASLVALVLLSGGPPAAAQTEPEPPVAAEATPANEPGEEAPADPEEGPETTPDDGPEVVVPGGAAAGPAGEADEERPSVWALSLEDAIRHGLRREHGIRLARLDRRSARTSVGVAEGAFDLRLSGSGAVGRTRRPFFSQNPFSGLPQGLVAADSDSVTLEGAIEKLFAPGTVVRTSIASTRTRTENAFALNPEYRPVIRVEVTQPLLRGLGTRVTGADVRRAELGVDRAEEETVRQAMETTISIIDAYWQYVLALEDLELRRQSLAVALDLLEVNRRKLEQGAIAEIEVLVAETGVATRREAIITARNEVLRARDALMALVQPDGPAGWNHRLIPTDEPRVLEGPVSSRAAFARAQRYRPEFRALEVQRRSRHLDVDVAENDLLPRVDFVGSMSWSGLGDNPDRGFDALGTGDFYEASIGFSLEWPVPNRSARAELRRARLDANRTDLEAEQLRTQVLTEVRNGVRDVETARERIRAAEQATRLAERQLEAERSKFDVGISTNHQVLEFEEDLLEARTSELQARIDLERAWARLQRAQGTILEAHGLDRENVTRGR